MSGSIHIRHLGGTSWDPLQYQKFADHRLRPALELLDRVTLTAPPLIYDLGCGSGEVTRLLAKRWPEARIVGLDSSKEMLATAASEPGNIPWVEADIRHWQPEAAPDLIYSNATLQWLEGHQELFPRLLGFLNPGGCLAVQMPLSWALPSHRLMRETLADGGLAGESVEIEELATNPCP